MTMRRHYIVPPVVAGGELPDVFSVVVPLARTNMLSNPSFETNTTGWSTWVSGGVARVATQQYHGAYSLEVTPSGSTSAGAQVGIALTTGVVYVGSCKFKGQAGIRYRIAFFTALSVQLVAYEFVASGRWQWVWVFYGETSSATRQLVISKVNSANAGVFYIDGVQVESCADGNLVVTTYLDGDQQGFVPNQSPPAYLWNGTPHASTSSRSGLTRAGGYVLRFKDYGLLLTAIIGLGLATPQNVATEYARIDGGYDDYTRKPSRQFSLVGRWSGRNYLELRDNRSLASVFDRDGSPLDQRLLLTHQIEGPCGDVQTDLSRIPCKYQDGLGGSTDNQYAETTPITFTNYLPAILADKEEGAALTMPQSVTNANRVLLRSAAGVWSAIGTGATGGDVLAIAQGLDGAYYIGGNFTAFGGVANTKGVAKYDPSTGTISAMGTGGGGGTVNINDIQIAPNGDVWVVGNYTGMGGVAGADYVSRWDGAAWNTVGVPPTIPLFTNPMQAAFGADGSFYVPRATTLSVYKWDGATWTNLGAVVGTIVTGALRMPNGDIIWFGSFTSINAVASTNAIRYSAGVFVAMSGTMPAVPNSMAVDASGRIYGGGQASPSNLFFYNGVQWTSIGNVGTGATTIRGLAAAPGGGMFLAGTFVTTNGIPISDGMGFWTGANVTSINVDLPGAPTVWLLRSFRDGSLGVGFNTSGTATAAGNTTITVSGTARTYPTLVIKGPPSGTLRIYQILNVTTGRAIYLNLVLNAGETAVLRFTPDNLSFISDFQGSIASAILPGSSEADFFLKPGANTISFFAADSTVTAVLYWRPAFVSLDDVP